MPIEGPISREEFAKLLDEGLSNSTQKEPE